MRAVSVACFREAVRSWGGGRGVEISATDEAMRLGERIGYVVLSDSWFFCFWVSPTHPHPRLNLAWGIRAVEIAKAGSLLGLIPPVVTPDAPQWHVLAVEKLRFTPPSYS